MNVICRWHPSRRYTTAFYLSMLIIVFAVAVSVNNSFFVDISNIYLTYVLNFRNKILELYWYCWSLRSWPRCGTQFHSFPLDEKSWYKDSAPPVFASLALMPTMPARLEVEVALHREGRGHLFDLMHELYDCGCLDQDLWNFQTHQLFVQMHLLDMIYHHNIPFPPAALNS